MLGTVRTVRVVSLSVTAAGAELARRLPFEHLPGAVADRVRSEWAAADGFVIIGAAGIAVRSIAPLLSSKATDPAVVCVDDGGHHVVSLVGGHAGGANDLAAEVAGYLSAVPVISTATDLAGLPALDRLAGFSAEGDVAAVTRQWLDGTAPRVAWDDGLAGWPVPFAAGPGGRVTVTDADRPADPGEVLLRPSSLVIGAGASRRADPEALVAAVTRALAEAGRSPACVSAVATIDVKADEPAIAGLAGILGVPLVTFPARVLAGVDVPNPS